LEFSTDRNSKIGMYRILLILFLLIPGVYGYTGSITICKDCEVKSVQEAIDLSSPGDSIFIEKGDYPESEIIIDKKLTLIGKDLPVIDGKKKGHVIKILADSIELSGLRIINVGKSYTKDYAAIYISRSRNFKIRNMVLEDVFFGILVEKSHVGLIEHNIISSKAVPQFFRNLFSFMVMNFENMTATPAPLLVNVLL